MITIAIDGYSSCGKSTVAKALAAQLGYTYVDTGAMYRAVTLYAMRKGLVDEERLDERGIVNILDEVKVDFKYNSDKKQSETLLNGENVEKAIRNMEVSHMASKVSGIKAVREFLVKQQREIGKEKGVVMDGRDIGTNVFPDAELKVFMTADPDVRAQRRYDELKAKGQKLELSDVKEGLEKRDYEDTHRKQNPLVKAKDAVVLDNSDLNKEQQLEYILRLIKDMQLIKKEENNINM